MSVKGNFIVSFDRKESLRCTFCGGSECSKCGLNAYKRLIAPAINLLHSHWITDEITAMQRPNEKSLKNGALQDMVDKRVTAVFNLTEPGEHPFCGCGNLALSGFPYMPETLMSVGIKHFNFSWQDMTVPTVNVMLDIVSIACRELQNGGKIAVHCHAGYGRTGLAIACILMMKESLAGESVITFVRNRRPGSIQTTAQSEFIHRFERHIRLVRQIFPTLEEINKAVSFNPAGRRRSVVCHSKAIADTIRDQQYFLSPSDLAHGRFRYLDKLIYFTAQSIAHLSYENYAYACLAITGLNKLSVKSNVDLSLYRRHQNDAHFAAKADYSPTGNRASSSSQLVRKRSSFMIASNSLSESTEQSMLSEVKIEINDNKWAKFMSYTDIISAGLRSSGESLSRIAKEDIDRQGSKTSLDHVSQSFRIKKGISNLTSSQRSLSRQSSAKNNLAIDHMNISHDNSLSQVDPSNGLKHRGLSPQGSFKAMLKTNDYPRQLSPKNLDIDAPIHENGSINTAPPVDANTSSDRDKKSAGGSIALPAISLGRGNSTSISFNRQASALLSGAEQQPIAQESTSKKKTASPSSMTGMRANSLRMNSESDYAKSKKMAANLTAQLLLDWLETRTDALLPVEFIEKLTECWTEHGQLSSNSRKKSEEKVEEANASYKQAQRDDSGSQPANTPIDRFNTAIVADYPPELVNSVYGLLSSHLDRYKLELLNALVVMYRYLRRAGLDWSALQLAKLQQEETFKDGSETQALDALVGLRLAIACMHARKRCPGLIRQRGLVMDIVKVFLLKSTNSEYVIINNITFSEESYQQIKNSIGVALLLHIDVVFRTLNLLVDNYWSCHDEGFHRGGSLVSWKEVATGIAQDGNRAENGKSE